MTVIFDPMTGTVLSMSQCIRGDPLRSVGAGLVFAKYVLFEKPIRCLQHISDSQKGKHVILGGMSRRNDETKQIEIIHHC